jgi:quinolinate synthase
MNAENRADVLLGAAEPLIELAIAEDIGPGDATSEATLAPHVILRGRIVAKERGVIAGMPVASWVFRTVEPAADFVAHVADGQEVARGELLAEVTGPGRGLLAAERTALNFLQRMSGIATLTSYFVDAVALTAARILDTRKTLPAYRVLDKYAVRMGGGENHRMSLFDMVLIKDNHIDSAGGIVSAVTAARQVHPDLPIEVEIRNLEELQEALSIRPPLDRIMLDNMTLAEMREAVALAAGRVKLEASGNVTLSTVGTIAATGVDFISAGALTHSARALDISMKVRLMDRERHGPDPAGRVQELKSLLGERLVILGHHYQRDEVYNLADRRGDSLKLARDGTQTDAQFIVFCGVHFMAETAAILAQPEQVVVTPDPSAGCYLADTATPGGVQQAWDSLEELYGDADEEVTPITYVNSSASLKAFCGQHGGIVCTSSNAEKALRWAFERRPRVFFFPDQHLGRNMAHRLGVPEDKMLRWHLDPGPDERALLGAQVILWPGACNVHQRFRAEHVQVVRERHPGIRVIVHPECPREVVELADDAGSTAHIVSEVGQAPAGTRWAIGTETRLVQRLRDRHPDQFIVSLADVPPFCRSMSQITLANLAQVLESLAQGEIVNQVTVDPEVGHWARVALQRMLELG